MLYPSLTQTQTQTLSLRQELIPSQIQSLEILQATIAELEQKVSELLAENPTLELVSTGSEELAGNPTEGDVPPPGSHPEPDGEISDTGENAGGNTDLPLLASDSGQGMLDHEDSEGDLARELDRFEESWREYMPVTSTGHAQSSEEEEERRQFRFDSLVAPITLQESLLEQFRQFATWNEKEQHLGEEIIGSIDETGYMRSHLADIAMSCNVEMEEAAAMLAKVQQLDPPGVGARDLRECLLLQLERASRRDSLEYRVVSKHLDDIGRNQIPKVARALHISPARLYDVLREIRRLAPFPGNELAGGEATVSVMAEVTIFKNEEGVWQVEPNREQRPRLRLSPYYLQLLKDPDASAETRSYIRQKLTESRLVLRAIANRQSTIERISWSLLKFQHDFFETGIEHLHPLTLTQVARDLSLHETTISRAVANKYVQTPHGLLPFRKFFSSGGGITTEGEKVSNATVKQKLQELIRAENPAKPLSDDLLARQLSAGGIQVARRTVAKYREELEILPSHLRKNFTAEKERV